jgi:hypothetical protein
LEGYDFRGKNSSQSNTTGESQMTKKEFTKKGGETWEWEETPEVIAALNQLHNRVKIANLKSDDDKLNYDTGGK